MPGIDNLNFNILLGTTTASAKGHLHQARSNLQSTKTTDVIIKEEDPSSSDLRGITTPQDNDNFHPKIHLKTNDCIYTIINLQQDSYTDLTGRFPHQSSSFDTLPGFLPPQSIHFLHTWICSMVI